MKLYVQLTIIFTISLIGEIISDGLNLPIPGSMIGLLILFYYCSLSYYACATSIW